MELEFFHLFSETEMSGNEIGLDKMGPRPFPFSFSFPFLLSSLVLSSGQRTERGEREKREKRKKREKEREKEERETFSEEGR